MHTLRLYYGCRLYSNRVINGPLNQPKYTFNGINFVLGDGITTAQTLNGIDTDESPSYLDATDEAGTTTLWFVISSQKTRQGQLVLYLKRDLLTEYWDKIKTMPFLCQKAATLPDRIATAKYLKTMNLSQVKKREYLLTDEANGRGWIVIYFNRTYNVPAGESSPWDSSGNAKIDSYRGNYTVTLKAGHNNCINSPCDILAIPLGGTLKSRLTGQADREIKLNSLRTALDLTYSISAHFSGMIADIQYLPYVNTPRQIDGNPDTDDNGWSRIIDNYDDSVAGWAIWQTNAYFTKQISVKDFSDRTLPADNMDQRKFNEEHMYRLCSPNFASSFEFSPVKNGAFPTFTVHGILRPINPYIYVEPSFEGLYGEQFNDGRGLILTGDFSLDQVSNAWATYKLQNKNYEQIFNRQIQTMDLQHSIANENMGWNMAHAISGGLSGTAGGAAAGAVLGSVVPGIGTAVGAIAGGLLSAGGGALDIADTYRQEKNGKALRDDAKNAAMDYFQYQTGNIQAIPNTLTKVSAINQDYKIYPLIEEYECTSQEVTNVNSAVYYNGVDVNMVAPLSSFSKGYIRGSVIQFPSNTSSNGGININEAQAQAINSELQAGIYYKEVY